MSRAIAYMVNEHPLYHRMLLNSMAMLRRYNPSIPVHAFLVLDQSRQTIERESVTRHSRSLLEGCQRLVSGCETMGATLHQVPPLLYPGEETFFHVNRQYLRTLPEEDILYLDADTFIFGDVETIFNRHSSDFAACEATWALARGWDAGFLPIIPFSSGIMLWNRGTIRSWCDLLPQYLGDFRSKVTPLSKWLYSLHSDCLLREEFSVSRHVVEQGLTSSYIPSELVRLIRQEGDILHLGDSTIFHCYTPNWRKCCRRLAGESPTRITPRRTHTTWPSYRSPGPP